MDTPAKYTFSTDYATLKNDSIIIPISLIVPASVVIPASIATASQVSYSATGEGGKAGSPMNITLQHSSNNLIYATGGYMLYSTQGIVLGSPAFYAVNIFVTRSGPTQFTLFAFITNPYAFPLMSESTARTITARVTTFLPPFS